MKVSEHVASKIAGQMQAAVEAAHGFGPGGQAVLTAPKKNLFESQGIQTIRIEGLNRILACIVLSLYAFGSMNMNVKFMKIIHRVAILASGNPYALKAIGSNFRGKMTVDCESALEKYEQIPNADLIQCLIGENNQIQLPDDTLEENMVRLIWMVWLFLSHLI